MGQQDFEKRLKRLRDKSLTTWGHDDQLAAATTATELVEALDRLITMIKGSNVHKLSYVTLRNIRDYARKLRTDEINADVDQMDADMVRRP
jgi:hypothetical protein